jgi:hypothetical protein
MTTRRTIDASARPDYKIKRFNGIIRFYRNCVGSSVVSHAEAPCIFPFVYHGQVSIPTTYIPTCPFLFTQTTIFSSYDKIRIDPG